MMDFATRLHSAVAILAVDVDALVNQRATIADEQRLKWELSCCILSGQVPYQNAVAAADHVQRALMDTTWQTLEQLRNELEIALSMTFHVDHKPVRYRFPRMRAHQLSCAFLAFRENYETLTEFVTSWRDPAEARQWLVQHVPGLGPKQASMFLRNIGVSYNLAVIDRHVMKYMELTRLAEVTSRSLSSLSHYSVHENTLRQYASSVGYEVGIVDWAIWIVMRAAKGMVPVE